MYYHCFGCARVSSKSKFGYSSPAKVPLHPHFISTTSEITVPSWPVPTIAVRDVGCFRQVVREARGTDSRLRGESSRLEELSPEEEGMVTKFLRELAMKVRREGSICPPPKLSILTS